VILDVVYNHTAEGNHLGPTFSFKGIDNATYYRLVAEDPRYYFDYTGTGNTLNVRSPQVLALIMDSLRYWATEMHVDGFRFDLASTLARQLHEVDQLSSFFSLIHQSPTLRQLKLIAEPWDVGDGGYQVGNFPVRWAEWNGRYRDAVRAYWRGDPGLLGEMGYRLTGSSDLYESGGRVPAASINFVTAHDGFTLRDLVSARATATATTTSIRTTTAPKARPMIRRSTPSAPASSAICSPRCCSRKVRRCWWLVTSSDARRAATTTPTARTTKSAGSTGSALPTSKRCSTSPSG
jgi:glycogen debranching enzyme GlgX